jgi:hypothetical protein
MKPESRTGFIIFHIVAATLTAALTMAVVTTGRSPKVALDGWSSDHYSHVFATVLFLSEGLDIYRKPIAELCSADPDHLSRSAALGAALDLNPGEVCWPLGGAADRPLIINWQQFPRPYPPGHLLYFLPEALAYKYFGAGFATINKLSVVKFAVVAHFAFVAVTLLLVGFRPLGLAWILGAIAYDQLMYFALAGIYDGIAILGVCFAMLLARRGRPSSALLVLSAAFFVHFRVLWMAPLAVYFAEQLYRTHRGAPTARATFATWTGGTIGMVLFACSAAVFLLLLPAMKGFPVENVLYLNAHDWPAPQAVTYFVVMLGAAWFLGALRSWLAVALLLWCSVVLMWTPQVQPWHGLMLLPILLVPTLDDGSGSRVESTVLLLFWFGVSLLLVFRTVVRFGWIADVYARAAGG